MDNYEKIVKEVAQLVVSTYKNAKTIKTEIYEKSHFDEVTSIDLYMEKKLIEGLKNIINADFLSEEYNSETDFRTKHLWVVDPLDGTINFSHGISIFGVQVAYVENGEIKLGVIFLPNTNELYYAYQNGGAYLNGQKIQTKMRDVNHSIISFGDYVHSSEKLMRMEDEFINKASRIVERVRMFGSAAVDLAYCASGKIDGSVTFVPNAWDIMPGIIIAKEAGCIIINNFEQNFRLFQKEILCVFSNKNLQNAIFSSSRSTFLIR